MNAAEETSVEKKTLRIALALNTTMFVIGFVAGVLAQSTGLIADSLDMLADALAFAIGLLAIERSMRFKGRAAVTSGVLLLILGLGVLLDVVRRVFTGSSPNSTTMIIVAATAFCVNSFVLYSLDRYREGEVHLRATWMFTKVDVIANLAVICAGLLVGFTEREWIDLVVGAAIGAYVVKEALEIIARGRAAAAG